MSIAGAIKQIQVLVKATETTTGYKIREAPDAPIQSGAQLPISVVYITSANGGAEDATWNLVRYTLTVEVHFNATSLRNAYGQINEFAPALLRLLSGDPTLSGEVETIIYPIDLTVGASSFDTVPTIGVSLSIPVKIISAHL